MSATQIAAEVNRIVLTGAPRVVIVDGAAVGDRHTREGADVQGLLTALGLDVVTLPLGTERVAGPAVAILGGFTAEIPGCDGWYVGPGAAPSWLRGTEGRGPTTTRTILSLLGTGMAQERAGAAFRAAGASLPVPTETGYDTASLWEGITTAVSPSAAPPSGSGERSRSDLDLDDCRDLLERSTGAIDRCCAPNGAIAAAPQALPGEPDYWFCWQRDAAHVAIALGGLAVESDDGVIRAWAQRRVAGYLGFVNSVGRTLGAGADDAGYSRRTMAGERVSGYGDPQVDGTAATALAVLRLVEDPRRALDIAGPFLAFLAGGATGQPGFDLWELTVGASFHAMNLARRALRRAAVVARAAADVAEEGYRAAAERYGLLLSAFHDPERGYLVHVLEPIPPWFAATSRLDVSVVGSVLLGFGPQDATDEVFGVADARVAATAAAVERHFAHRWPVNAAWHQAGNLGSGIGRFPEDCNDGMGSTHGNPWPVASLWLAQFHLRQLEVRPDRSPGDIASAVALASGYLAFVLEHASPASISEQIDAVTGRPRGVALLAWAHAELVVTVLALQRWLG